MHRIQCIWRRLLCSLIGVVLIGGCIGDRALDEEHPITIGFQTPWSGGDEATIEFGSSDATALGLEQPSWPVDEGPGYGATLVPTTLTQSASVPAEYCMAEPIHLLADGERTLLIEEGECFGGAWTTFDRTSVRIIDPEPGTVVGPNVELTIDSTTPGDGTIQVFVNGEFISQHPIDTERIDLDLADLDLGPFVVRVANITPGGNVRAATVIELTR